VQRAQQGQKAQQASSKISRLAARTCSTMARMSLFHQHPHLWWWASADSSSRLFSQLYDDLQRPPVRCWQVLRSTLCARLWGAGHGVCEPLSMWPHHQLTQLVKGINCC
jgi:hypothetical protein